MGIKTGFRDIDDRIDGFGNGDLICIASRPTVGKKVFAYNLVTNIAQKEIPILIFSLENCKSQTLQEIFDVVFAINRTEDNKVYSEERHTEDIRNSILVEQNTCILDNSLSIESIEQNAKLMKLQKDIGLIIIDYLQLIKHEGTLEEVIIRLKKLAKELNIPIIILSQLSNELESREDKRPTLADFKNSACITDYADTIMFIYRDDYYNKDSERKNIVEVIVAKTNREITGTAELLNIRNKYVNMERYRRSD